MTPTVRRVGNEWVEIKNPPPKEEKKKERPLSPRLYWSAVRTARQAHEDICPVDD